MHRLVGRKNGGTNFLFVNSGDNDDNNKIDHQNRQLYNPGNQKIGPFLPRDKLYQELKLVGKTVK